MVDWLRLETAPTRILTGIPGFDEIIGGGFPPERVILILGEPGSGKTILSSQFLYNGATKYGESGLLVSMEERKGHYLREMSQFGWDFPALEKSDKFTFVDASPIRTSPDEIKVGTLTVGRHDFSMISLLEVVRNAAKKINTKRIIIDAMSLLLAQYPDDVQRRKALLDVVEAMSETGATCVLSAELHRVGIKGRVVQIEEYLVHGVILMQTIATGRTMERTIQVEKMRETQIDRQPRPYRITGSGIEVYPRESVL